MSILEQDKIDFIGTEENNTVVLTISDHLNWDNKLEHLNILQTKLNTYLSFIESGQLYENYPNSKGKTIVIRIVSEYEYKEEGNEFLEKVRPILDEIEVLLEQRIYSSP